MKKNNRNLVLFLILTMMLSLAACNDEKEEPSPEPSPVSSESSVITTEAAPSRTAEEEALATDEDAPTGGEGAPAADKDAFTVEEGAPAADKDALTVEEGAPAADENALTADEDTIKAGEDAETRTLLSEPNENAPAKETVFTFTVKNETGRTLEELFLYPDGTVSPGQNLLDTVNAGNPLADGQTLEIPSAAIDYGSNDPLIVNYTLAYTADDQTVFQYDGIAADDCILLLMPEDLDIQ